MPTLALDTPGWSLANVRINHEPEMSALHVWGELVNYSGGDQRVETLVPTLRDGDYHPLTTEEAVVFPLGLDNMLADVSLADGHSVPFGFELHLPTDVSIENGQQIILSVIHSPAESTRENFDILHHSYDLVAWPERLEVNGVFDNPGPALQEYVTFVITAYDTEGRVAGWGWSQDTAASFLQEGGHHFVIRATGAEIVSKLDLQLGSYKVFLFGR
jgi:hypothetical protein